MSAVMILFAFSLSLVINFIQKMVHSIDDNSTETETNDRMNSYAVEEAITNNDPA